MRVASLNNRRGLTLVEVLVAMLILLGVSLAMMQTALVGIDSNMRNVLRDQAVSIAEMRANMTRNLPFDSVVNDSASLSSCDCPSGFPAEGICISKDVRNVQGLDYCTRVACQEFGGDGNCGTADADLKQIDITVGWKWKGEGYTHTVTSVRNRND